MITRNENKLIKLELKQSEIEFIIEALEFSPYNLYKFLDYGSLVKKLRVFKDGGKHE